MLKIARKLRSQVTNGSSKINPKIARFAINCRAWAHCSKAKLCCVVTSCCVVLRKHQAPGEVALLAALPPVSGGQREASRSGHRLSSYTQTSSVAEPSIGSLEAEGLLKLSLCLQAAYQGSNRWLCHAGGLGVTTKSVLWSKSRCVCRSRSVCFRVAFEHSPSRVVYSFLKTW